MMVGVSVGSREVGKSEQSTLHRTHTRHPSSLVNRSPLLCVFMLVIGSGADFVVPSRPKILKRLVARASYGQQQQLI